MKLILFTLCALALAGCVRHYKMDFSDNHETARIYDETKGSK